MPLDPWISVSETKYPDDPEAAEAVSAATFVLHALSGRKYSGIQTITEVYAVPFDPPLRVRPNVGLSSIVTAPGRPYIPPRGSIRLRKRPVFSINQIRVGRERRVIPEDEWELYNGSSVRPADGASWRVTGEIEITYTAGAYPPEAGKRAARVLANELLLSRIDPGTCRLPERVTSISREGISMSVIDPQTFMEKGKTGIYEVDLFLNAVNPSGAKTKPRVTSPDLPQVRRINVGQPTSELGVSDLGIVRGEPVDKTFNWIVSGSPVQITSRWTPSAAIYDREGGIVLFDLSSYVIVEPNAVTGSLELSVPADVTEQIPSGGAWNLSMVRTNDPTTTVRIVSGKAVVENPVP